MTYEIHQGKAGESDYTFYGGVRDFVRYKGSEAIVHGPAESGKTLGTLWKLHLCACKYPNASLVIARKTLASTFSTVLQTYMNKVLGEDEDSWPCERYGGEKPEWFDYDNGSRVWIAGLDKSSKILSAEHDLVYVNQTEELALEDWETLTTRTTGRAGNMPYAQTIGDANPAWPAHWMYHRESLRIFYSRHSENPALYDQRTGEITEQGKRTMAVLERLTGVRRMRLLKGLPDRPEGVIYSNWDEAVHLIYAQQLPHMTRYVAGQDWGFTHPGVLGFWGQDSDGRLYLVAQVYHTRKVVSWWLERLQELSGAYGVPQFIACDPSEPQYIEQYRQAGFNAVPAPNAVRAGIDKVMERLAPAGDGRPRLFIVRDSLSYRDEELVQAKQPHAVEQEIQGYVWADTAKEQPVKEHDHGCDMIRYTVALEWLRTMRAPDAPDPGSLDVPTAGPQRYVGYRGRL